MKFHPGLIFLILISVAISIAAQHKSDNKTVLANFEKDIENGKLSEIERDLFNFVVANPNDASGFSLLAKLRLKQNRLNEAKALANKALSIENNLISAKMVLAQVSFQSGEIEQVRQILNSISEKEIPDSKIRLSLSQTLALVGECPKALKIADLLPLKIKNNEALPLRANCYLETGNKQNFLLLIPLAKKTAKENPNISVEFAEVMIKALMFKEAIDLLRLTIVSSPNNTNSLLLLAKSEILLKDFSNAQHHLAQVEKVDPNSAELFFVRSLLESEQGKYDQAFESLEKSLSINSNDAKVLAQYVVVALQVRQSGRAMRAAEKLLKLQPDDLEALYFYGVAALQNNNPQNAETSLVKFMTARPNDSRGCLALGLTYAAQPEKLDTARRQLQDCLVSDPKNSEAAFQLGLSYKTVGDFSNAVKYFEQTIKISPTHGSALRELGSVYLQTGEEALARPILEKAVQINPNDADAHFQLSRLYNLMGERELAKKHLEIFQKLKTPKKEGM